jgi:preprotein translocase subunit YajC
MKFGELLPFVLLIGAFWLLILRPMQRQKAAKAALLAGLRPGAEVITSGGIHRRVVALDGEDNLVIAVADGVRMRFLRSAVAAIKDPGSEHDPSAGADDADADGGEPGPTSGPSTT